MTHTVRNSECFVIQLLERLTLTEVGYVKTSFHRIDKNEYSANIAIVNDVMDATCKYTVDDAWDLGEFVTLHLFSDSVYTFRIIETFKGEITTYIPKKEFDTIPPQL
jgi:hypothetical protein